MNLIYLLLLIVGLGCALWLWAETICSFAKLPFDVAGGVLRWMRERRERKTDLELAKMQDDSR